RDTLYGHKVFFTGGRSGLILDCMIESGNPCDTALFQPMVERQEEMYERVPRQVAADGGFASTDNLHWAKQRGVKDVAFANGCTGSSRTSAPALKRISLNSNAPLGLPVAPGRDGPVSGSISGVRSYRITCSCRQG
ncbi:MAG: transposase, partial [Deltaproteobacteria bacterium]|nr:transposase [Deltaproteobacteria bacterium]